MVQEYEKPMQGIKQPFSQSQMTDDGRYKTLFEQVNAAAILTTLDGTILEANQKSCELFRYCWEDVLRLSLRNILPKEIDWTQFVDEVAARGGLHIETETICKDGCTIPVEISISLFSMNKQPVMFVLIWDITDRRNAEKRIRESEKKYHGLFEYTTDGIIVLDAHGDILDVNTKICAVLDVTKDFLIQQNLFNLEFLTTKSLPIVIRQFEQLLSEKTAKCYTTQITNKQGRILDVDISSFFLVKKENEVDNFVLIIRDSTEKNEAEKKRAQEHELLKTLLENIPDSVYFKDEKNRFVLVNKAKADRWNVSSLDMIGKTDFDFMPKEQAQQAYDDDTMIIQTGKSIIDKFEKITGSDGVERWFSVTKIPWFNSEGEIVGTMGISRDVTQWYQQKK